MCQHDKRKMNVENNTDAISGSALLEETRVNQSIQYIHGCNMYVCRWIARSKCYIPPVQLNKIKNIKCPKAFHQVPLTQNPVADQISEKPPLRKVEFP